MTSTVKKNIKQSKIVYFEVRRKFGANIIPTVKTQTFMVSTQCPGAKRRQNSWEQRSEVEPGKKWE